MEKEALECPQCRTPAAPKLQYCNTVKHESDPLGAQSEIEFSFEIEFEPNAPALGKILSVPDRSIFRSKMDSIMSPKWTP